MKHTHTHTHTISHLEQISRAQHRNSPDLYWLPHGGETVSPTWEMRQDALDSIFLTYFTLFLASEKFTFFLFYSHERCGKTRWIVGCAFGRERARTSATPRVFNVWPPVWVCRVLQRLLTYHPLQDHASAGEFWVRV